MDKLATEIRSLHTAANKASLEVDPITVKRDAVRLNLPFPRTYVRPTTTAGVDRMLQRRQSRLDRIVTWKNNWLGLLVEHPKCGAKKLRNLSPALYAALYRADRLWLRTHQPPCQRIRPTIRVDWKVRDQDLLQKLKTALISLTVTQIRPKQITIAALGRKAQARARLEKHLDKLPNCRIFLRSVTEDKIKYALRRLGYVAATLQRNQEAPAVWRILRAAGVRADLAKSKLIRQYVEKFIKIWPGYPTCESGERIRIKTVSTS
jgi:hypothetical protein